jgi:NCS1 family nucleobase:cation symporter-1
MEKAATEGPSWLKWAELPPRKDVYQNGPGTTRWGNHDLYPIPKKERTFGYFSYFAYWITTGISVGTFTLGSSYIAVGLNAGETLGAILIGCVISCAVGILCGKPGMDYNLGYVGVLLEWK